MIGLSARDQGKILAEREAKLDMLERWIRIYPKLHHSEGSLFRSFIIPKLHDSDASLIRNIKWGSLIRKQNGVR